MTCPCTQSKAFHIGMAAKRHKRPRPLHRKPKHNQESDEVYQYGFHCVAFLDILGQRRKLLQLAPIPRKDEETTRVLRETAGNVVRLRQRLAACFEGFGTPTLYLDQLPPDARERILNARQSLRNRNVGDSIIMDVSFLGDEDRCASMIGVYGCIASCCILHLVGLSTKSPIRGGIDVGLGLDIGGPDDPEVYGPVLGKAYTLENKLAEYPRILVSNGLLEYLEKTSRLSQTTPLGRLATYLAEDCKRFITVDTDGKPMLDFLGEKMATLSAPEKRQLEFAQINECVAEQRQMARLENDAKLLIRYDRLFAYVEKRSAFWK
jgi:hypothetical protein